VVVVVVVVVVIIIIIIIIILVLSLKLFTIYTRHLTSQTLMMIKRKHFNYWYVCSQMKSVC